MRHSRRSSLLAAIWALALLACSPNLNWRELRDADARYTVLLPAKPASHSRTVTLGEMKVDLHMTAAEADEMSFAVASALIDDAAQRSEALELMQQAMVKNIAGNITHQKIIKLKDGTEATEIEARGALANGNHVILFARFAMKDQRVYQAVAMGPPHRLSAEIADTFLASFALQ
ncbi:MAG: hypothetical protein ACKOAO_10190 [Oxalobacteraceae bacterium]